VKLKGRVALITGASRGIGKATALLFAKEGANVAVNFHHSEEEANKVVAEIEEMGQEALAVRCDVSNEEQVKEMVGKVVEKLGKLDILVNNAGIVIDVPFRERTVDQWRKTLDTNLIGPFLCAKYASVPMLKQKYGRIVNVSSTSALNDLDPDAIDYDTSKAGVITLTRDLAEELAPHVLVNSVAPGWVDTDMNRKLSKEYIKKEIAKIYLKRFAQPEEIAKAILFLASDDASFITGSVLVADGGH